VKNCKLCRFSQVCNDLPFFCVLLQYLAVAGLIGFLAWLAITSVS